MKLRVFLISTASIPHLLQWVIVEPSSPRRMETGALKKEIHSLLKTYGLKFSDEYGFTEVLIT